MNTVLITVKAIPRESPVILSVLVTRTDRLTSSHYGLNECSTAHIQTARGRMSLK